MTYQPLFISEQHPTKSTISVPPCGDAVDELLRLFHLYYKDAMSFYNTSFFEHTDKTFGCLMLNPDSFSYSAMKDYDFRSITLEDDFIYVMNECNPKINNFRNFYCSFPTLIKLTSSYKYFIDYFINCNASFKNYPFYEEIMMYISSTNMKVKYIK